MTISIVEVMGRAQQGATQPFICRGDDGLVYFVKGSGAGRRSQILELLAGSLAQRLGLPIAPFVVADVPPELLRTRSRSDLSELGSGLAFASCRRSVVELTAAQVDEVPFNQQQDVFAFDWWIRNADRTLSERGGNPNLFWDGGGDGLVVIDHNQAFDPDFDPNAFVDQHVFGSAGRDLLADWLVKKAYQDRFKEVFEHWPSICQTVPPEWLFVDAEQTVATDFDFDIATEILLRHTTGEKFWNQE